MQNEMSKEEDNMFFTRWIHRTTAIYLLIPLDVTPSPSNPSTHKTKEDKETQS